ncbi:MAG: MFS transporter [Planctomycetia bacterium]|nr:MFS transporter [Planctomycetia bacterium]
MQDTAQGQAAPNAQRLLWAGFMAILAAGVGFAIRGGIFDNWRTAYEFSDTQLGAIGGAGFSGFCFGIIIGGMLCDKIGYGKLVVAAFVLHVLSAVVTFGASTPENAYNMLYWGMFLFALANGCLEAVANPLVATLFPNNRTHYLNILHASWPAGLILGGALGWVLDDRLKLDWKLQLSLYLIPTVIYGVMFLGQSFPKSEASQKGLKLGEMFKDVGILGGLIVCYLLSMFLGDVLKPLLGDDNAKLAGYAVGGVLLAGVGVLTKFSMGSVLLFVLFLAHALVGAVELGTDGWIQNITGNILSSEQGKILFVFTSALMFALRFCADFIEKRLGLSPIGILVVCAILACIGLNLTSGIKTFSGALVALTVYGIGKTFFWPTMLAVASDRFPRTGAIAISIMGGVGMMSAGLIGSPGLGYAKDRFAGEALKTSNAVAFESYKAEKPSKFLVFDDALGLNGKKLGEAQDKLNKARETADGDAARANLSAEELNVVDASIAGDRKTLVADSFIPATMAAIYLLLLIYFKTIGGYKPVTIADDAGQGKAG